MVDILDCGDEKLIELCRQFAADTRTRQQHDVFISIREPTMDAAELDLLLDRWFAALDEITTLPARTAAGTRAKSGALGHALTVMVKVGLAESFEEQAGGHELLAMSLVRDLATVPD